MSKESKFKNFDPNSPATGDGNIFGLPFTTDEAELILIPVPWDVTVSYAEGTSCGPQAIFEASAQVDLFDPLVKDSWKIGVAMEEISKEIFKKNTALRKISSKYISNVEKGISTDTPAMKSICTVVNKGCTELKSWVKKSAEKHLKKNKLVGLVGGDHSTPLGLMEALAEKHSGFGILQIDAHCDLRKAYEGFKYSHASIMYNALRIPQIKKLVQVGIRDWCEEENNYINSSNGKVKTFFDFQLKEQLYRSRSWVSICSDIIQELPKHVYISFDIDGLDPKLCPNSGTPVPGGLEFEQAVFLFEMLARSGKKIIGFDLNEVAPGNNEWNGNVGARMLFRMCNLAAASNGLATFNQ
ncbi:MAG: agmatinase family protein [Bacteroidetes bacterium]|nr:agmatinase family protein [Bacteroidota bacterium]